MGLFSFLHGRTGKLFIHRLYGWGAALVILGALFKLMHWEGAGLMLTIGMTTECIIFFFSAFEPMAKEYDWSLVYPELAEGGEIRDIPKRSARQVATTNEQVGTTGVVGGIYGANLDLGVTPESATDLKTGIQKLTSSLNQMTNLAGVVDVTNDLTNNMRKAATSMASFADSTNMLTDNYQRTAQTIGNLNEQSKSGLEQIRLGYDAYRGQLDSLGNTLGAVNSSFELYLEEAKRVQVDYGQLHVQMSNMVENLQVSAEQTQRFGNQITGLNNNIEQLNSVYGSMLTTVNTVLNK